MLAAQPSARLRFLFLLLFAALVCLRMPGILWHGRIWAEEGLLYQNAWTMPAAAALTVEYGGYLNLIANAATVLARYSVPLVDTPWVLTGIALIFQLCPAVLVVTCEAGWLRTPLAMAATLVFLATSSLGEEVFLHTLHSQYHLTLCVAFILSLDDRPGPAVRWFRRALLLLAPLSGLLAIVLLPLFGARTLLDRTRERMIQCGCLLLGALIQWGLFYSPADGAALGRSGIVWPGLLVQTITLRQIITPLLGVPAGVAIGDGIRVQMLAQAVPLWTLLIFTAVVVGLGWLCLSRLRSGASWLLVSAFVLAGVSYYGAIGGGLNLLDPLFGQRYAFVPDILIGWTLICLAFAAPMTRASRVARFFAAWIVLASIVVLPRSLVSVFAAGPDWRAEIQQWRADPSHLIELWPKGWTMQLNPDHSPAPQASKTF